MASSWLDRLNPAQRRAVTAPDGPLLVIAGAGTGKTMTLACRVAWLIERGVPPERILLLTFTRRAATEMLSRAGRMTDARTAGRVWGGTFHATANRLLRMHGRAVGLKPDFTVMDESDAADLMSLIRNEGGIAKGDRRFPTKHTLAKAYSYMVNARRKLAEVLDAQFPWCREDIREIRAIFEEYAERKRARNVVDYDDLLLFWKALCLAPGVGDALNGMFDHILVDEYQDTNAIQAEILAGMRRTCPNIMVVGDDAQSIYSFRAATVRNILDFPAQFPGTQVVTLEQNYRSTQPILAASNAVIAQARERYAKELYSERPSDQRPALVACVDEAEQVDLVCSHVLAHHEAGTPLRKQAVLFRAGHHSDMLEVELARRNIPFHKYGGLKFIEAAHIKDVLAILRILENPFDEVSWFRLLLLLDGVGPRTARRMLLELGVCRDGEVPDANGAPVSPLNRLLTDPLAVPAGARTLFEDFRSVVADCTGLGSRGAKEPPLAAQLERIRRFYEPIVKRNYENANMRLRDLEQLEQIAARCKSRARFITDLTLDPPTSTADFAGPPMRDEDWLVLSTVHSAKGCEWDVVHIIHAADGMFPSDMATGSDESIDEERRLFYVAMTRARDMLYIYCPLRYYHRRSPMSDAHSYAQMTRFLPASIQPLFVQRFPPVHDEDDQRVSWDGVDAVQADLRRLWED